MKEKRTIFRQVENGVLSKEVRIKRESFSFGCTFADTARALVYFLNPKARSSPSRDK